MDKQQLPRVLLELEQRDPNEHAVFLKVYGQHIRGTNLNVRTFTMSYVRVEMHYRTTRKAALKPENVVAQTKLYEVWEKYVIHKLTK